VDVDYSMPGGDGILERDEGYEFYCGGGVFGEGTDSTAVGI